MWNPFQKKKPAAPTREATQARTVAEVGLHLATLHHDDMQRLAVRAVEQQRQNHFAARIIQAMGGTT